MNCLAIPENIDMIFYSTANVKHYLIEIVQPMKFDKHSFVFKLAVRLGTSRASKNRDYCYTNGGDL